MPRPMTVAEKILAAHAASRRCARVSPSNATSTSCSRNHITAPIAIDVFHQLGATEVFDRDRVCLVPDHYAPNKGHQEC